MTRRTQLTSLFALGGALLLGSAVYSQGVPPGPGGPPPGYPGAGGPPGMAPAPGAPGAPGATDMGAVDNTQITETSTMETTTVDGDTLPNTGGAPLLMTLVGSLTAGGALLLRRKIG